MEWGAFAAPRFTTGESFMPKLIHAIVILMVLAFGPAHADATQLALVERTFEAMRQSSTALEQGDTARAQSLLNDIKGSAEALRNTAEGFAKQAGTAADRREAEARDVTTRITETFRAEQAADQEINGLEARIADLNAQLVKANATRDQLEAQSAIHRQEVQMRQECKAHFWDGIFYSTECWRLSFEDVFAHRWINLNNEIDSNQRQRNEIERARWSLQDQLSSQQRTLAETRARKAELETQRSALEQQSKTLRAAVVSLSDAAVFWTDTVTLIGSNISTIDTLQQGLQLLAKRAGNTAPAPVFDRYDQEAVRSLEDTLKDFARTLDDRSNILLTP
jgi:DNA repair exonuclease SbcCD ATPase subunit